MTDVSCMRKRLYTCILPRSIVGGLAFQILLFCRHLFICGPACAVVLRMSSVAQKWKRCVLSIQQKLEIWIVWGWLEATRGSQQSMGLESQLCSTSIWVWWTCALPSFRLAEYWQGSVPTCSDDWHSTVFLIHILFRVDNFYKIANVLMYFVYTWICSAIWLALPDLTTRSQVQFFWRVLPCSPIPPQGEPLEWSHT